MTEAILRRWGFKDDHHGFVLCPDCLEPREHERPDGMPQLCSCERHREDPRWPGHDFNERIHLCEICQVHVLDSGSKWHVWFCNDCQPRVRSDLLAELDLRHEVKLSDLVLAFAADERASKDVMFDRFVAGFGEALGVSEELANHLATNGSSRRPR